MPAIAAGAAVLGAGVQIYGAITSANAQAQQDQEKAQIATEQATEIAAREVINDQQRQISANKIEGEIGAAAGGSGFATTGIGAQLEAQRQTNVQIALNDRDAAFQETQLLKGANMESTLASQTQQSGDWKAAGTVLGLVGTAASPSTGLGKLFSGPAQGLTTG